MEILDQHRKTAIIVKLEDFKTTKSLGGVVTHVIRQVPYVSYWGNDLKGNKAIPSPLLKFYNKDGTEANPTTYKIIWTDTNSNLDKKVYEGWILDAQTGTQLRDPNR